MDVVLVHPEIPHNSGCAGRLTAAVGARLHLVQPLGFSLDDRHLKRAGLDYWPLVDLVVHAHLAGCLAHLEQGGTRPIRERLRLFSARGGTSLFETAFAADDVLVFGSESKGLPASLLEDADLTRVYVPIRSGIRSLNLANTVGIALYTAMDRAGVRLPDNDGTYAAHPDAAADIWPRDVARLPGAEDDEPATGR